MIRIFSEDNNRAKRTRPETQQPEMLCHQRWLLLLVVMVWTTDRVHSMGTLLHAGPSCIIKPPNHHHYHHHHSHNLHHYHQPVVKHRGICYSALLCKQKGGVAIGKCGLGNSCCVFPQTCNSISVRNSTYFTSPDYPSNDSGDSRFLTNHHHHFHSNSNEIVNNDNNNDGHVIDQHHHEDHHEQTVNDYQPCSLTIHRMPGIHPICRIRLDFIEYDVEGQTPSTTTSTTITVDGQQQQQQQQTNDTEFHHHDGGGCNGNGNHGPDRITMETRNHHQNEPIMEIICPNAKIGQHVIIDVRKHLGPFVLTVHPGHSPGKRRWNILINQIECQPLSKKILANLIIAKR